MKKCIIDIRLAKEPSFHSSHCKNTLDRHHFSNRAESFKVVQTLLLSKSFGNQPSLIPLNRPICLVLNPIDPLAPYRMFSRRQNSDNPSVIGFQTISASMVACHLGLETACEKHVGSVVVLMEQQ